MIPVYVWFFLLLIVLSALLFAFPSSSPPPPPPPPLPAAPSMPAPPPLPAKENRGPTKVFDLRNDAEAEEFVSGDKGVLMVYAPWCGHCKNMMPAYDSASTQTTVKFARLEGSNAPAFMAKHQIRGFPTILSIKDKIISRYNSGRDEASLLAHASSL